MPFCLPFSSSKATSKSPIDLDLPSYQVSEKEAARDDPYSSIWDRGSLNESKERLSKLRGMMIEEKIDYYVVPSEDEHQSEWVAEQDQRRAYLTSFTGSAGTAIVSASASTTQDVATGEGAWLFVDSRYWIQASKEISSDWKMVKLGEEGSVGSWMEFCLVKLPSHSRIGIDPLLLPLSKSTSLATLLETKSSSLVPISKNLIDAIRPAPPPPAPGKKPLSSKIEIHGIEFSGEEASSKLSRVRSSLFSTSNSSSLDSQSIYLLATLPSIAYFLNLRCSYDSPGFDIPNIPVFKAYLALTVEECILFVEPEKVEDDVKGYLGGLGVEIRGYGVEEVGKWVEEKRSGLLSIGGQVAKKQAASLRVFANTEISWGLARTVTKSLDLSSISIIPCPINTMKGVKNKVELEGFRKAYLRDGVATVKWMAWLEHKIVVEGVDVGEVEAGDKLTEFRSVMDNYRGLAYENISASGPNGALPHYMPKTGQDSIIDKKTPYVIDAGAQYLDGTIDTTRTMHFGIPTADQKRAFTRVLQGHIAVETTPFPKGFKGDRLDTLGRSFLFQDGLNYGHGTGHGIGSYLSVHEGPAGLGIPVAFEPGHITSNEPGFYLEGHWGIRIESVLICQPTTTKYDFGGQWLGWEPITQVPIQTSLIDWSVMTPDQMKWVVDHNKRVRERIRPFLLGKGDKLARRYLDKCC